MKKEHPLKGIKKSKESIAKRIKTIKENGSLTGSNNPKWKGGISKITGYCEYCGKEKIWDAYGYKNSKHHFCSRECKIKFYQKNYTGVNHIAFKGVIYCCDNCQKECYTSQSEYNRYKFHFCSRECDNQHRIDFGRCALENNNRWEGGNSFKGYPFGWTEKFKEHIRSRDNNTCQDCKIAEIETGEKLNVHHIDCNKDNLDENNLISLCRNCHMIRHNEIRRLNKQKLEDKI